MNRLIEPNKENKPKYIFFSGKGGVGKSTMSCATAVWLARKGYKTLLVTTDPAPNIGDIFNQEIGHKITAINGTENLFAIEINPDIASDIYREKIISPMREVLDEKNLNTIKEQLNSPCVEEVAAFDKFIEYMDNPQYDVIIFDTAPTGHTIRLLELPTDWKGFIDIGSLAKKTSEITKKKYMHVIETMRDSNKSTFIFVMFPEYTPIIEAKRASEDLKNQVGINTSMIAVNYLLPDEYGNNDFFRHRKKQQKKYLNEINKIFKTPIIKVPLFKDEPTGLEELRLAGTLIYNNYNSVDINSKRIEVSKN